MSYSRHAVDDKDLALQHDVNYKVHMHVRRMMSENRAARRRKGERVKAANSNMNNNGSAKSRQSNATTVRFLLQHTWIFFYNL